MAEKTAFADHEWQREKLGTVQAAKPKRAGPRRAGLLGDIEIGKLGKIARRFSYPPFSILNAREGIWQQRKALWLSLGIKSELGRFETAVPSGRDGIGHTFSISADGQQFQKKINGKPVVGISADGTAAAERANTGTPFTETAKRKQKVSPGGSPRRAADYGKSHARGDGTGKAIVPDSAYTDIGQRVAQYRSGKKAFGTTDEQERYREKDKKSKRIQAAPGGTGTNTCWIGAPNMGADYAESETAETTGTSIFDPVLTELSYKWFCPPGGKILDPFAGGSVRGVVAGYLGYRYRGIELRPEQSNANRQQAADILGPDAGRCEWIDGDSTQIDKLVRAEWADFVFSCPPYGDLEVYSDDPRDLSQMDFDDFVSAYRTIIRRTSRCLRNNRFAVFVVGDYRLKNGFYANFTNLTIDAFARAGMPLYNSAVLITAVGSLPIRISKQFESGRKLGRTHQDYLCFCKGDWRKAAAKCGKEIA